jgi:5'-3' exonuclease
MIVHLLDGTYELFRHFYGLRRIKGQADVPLGAVAGMLGTCLQMLNEGATHIGVATDHVIESFRNDLYDGYKTGDGNDPALWEQFHPLEDALAALGVATWPLVEHEADDGLASAAAIAAADPRVGIVRIWTPDKDLAQCVQGRRVVQVDRRTGVARDEAAVVAKFGVPPASIPDWLALVGDTADGYPGIPGWGAKSAAAVLAVYGSLEAIPDRALDWSVRVRGALGLASELAARRKDAALFKVLATLRRDSPVSSDVDAMEWHGPLPELARIAKEMGAQGIAERATALAASRAATTRR